MSASFRAEVGIVVLCGLAGCLLPGALGPDMIDGTTETQEDTGEPPWQVPSASSGGTGSSGSTGSNEHSFLADDPDDGDSSIECSVWDQDCPAGEKCMPWANDGGNHWNASKCTSLAPDPAKPGEPCIVEGSRVGGIDDCGVASMCWEVDPDTNTGTCIAFCTGSEANPLCENPDELCSFGGDGVLVLCLPTCDPLVQDCPVGKACYGISDGFACASDASADAGAYGEGCEYVNACGPGFACMNAEVVPGCSGSQGCCTRFCGLDDPDPPCHTEQSCVPWYEEDEAHPQWLNVGVCMVPQ